MKVTPRLLGELVAAGHAVSVKGRFYISLESLQDVEGRPAVPKPPEPEPQEEAPDVGDAEMEGEGSPGGDRGAAS